MKKTLVRLLGALILMTSPAFSDELSTRAAVGSGLAGALGAFLGGELAGRNGAILASGLSAAVGAAVATSGYWPYSQALYDDKRWYRPGGQPEGGSYPGGRERRN